MNLEIGQLYWVYSNKGPAMVMLLEIVGPGHAIVQVPALAESALKHGVQGVPTRVH